MPRNATAAAKRKPGRPAHAPTAQLRRKVSVAAGAGMRHEDIAIAIGVSRPTLELHYSAELTEGALTRRMEVLQALHTAAKKGSSSAARAYLAVEPRVAVPPPVGDAAGTAATPPGQPTPKAQPLGKKDQANVDARTAQVGTGWDDLLPSTAPLQ